MDMFFTDTEMIGPTKEFLTSAMVRRLSALFVVVALAVGLVGCDQFDLNEPQPTTSVSISQTVNSTTGFNSLINSGYDRLQGVATYGQIWTLYPDALADNAQTAQRGGNRYHNVISNQPRNHMQGWGAMYSTINEMNVVIDNIEGFTPQAENPQAVKDRIRGEALFLRGLAYFDLMRIYAYMPGSIDGRNREPGDFSLGVPISLEPTLSTEDAEELPRAENSEVYNQVISDFQKADSLLANIRNTSTAPSGPNRATAAAAAGMLSRVHLYLTNWQQAEAEATRALNLTNAEVVDSGGGGFEAAWFASSYPGSVFELTMTSGQDATGADGLQDITYFTDPNNDGTPLNFAYQLVVSDDAESIFAAGDARQSLFAQDPDGETYIEKYNGTISQFADRIPLLRVAELYLNRAEARAQQSGQTSGAQDDLNYIRVRRGLSRINPTGQALVNEILEERRREFLFEGKRFFTLKRYARDIPKPQVGGSIDFDGPLDERRLILSNIPNGVLQSNGALVQNPGY